MKDNHLFEDLYKVAGSAMNNAFATVADFKKQVEDMVQDKVEELLSKYGYISREEFEVVKQMAQQARIDQDELLKRIDQLEKKSKDK